MKLVIKYQNLDWWLFIPLFIGMVLVVLFDRCGIARVLILMSWNKGVKLS